MRHISIIRNAFLQFGVAALLVGVGRVIFLLLLFAGGRLVDIKEFGLFLFSLATSQVLAFACALGTGPAAQIIVREALTLKRPHRIGTFIRSALLATLVCSTIASLFVLVLGLTTKFLIGWTEVSETTWPLIGFIPVMAFSMMREFLARTFGAVFLTFVPRDIIWTGLSLAALVSVPFAGNHFTLVSLGLLFIVELIAWILLWRRYLSDYPCLPGSKIRFFSRWRKTSLAMMSNYAASMSFERVDMIMVGIFVGLTQAGTYGMASRIAPIVSISQRFVVPLTTPRFATILTQRDRGALLEELRTATLMSSLTALPLFLLIVVGAPTILALAGQEFVSGSFVLQILGVAYLANAVCAPCGALLTVAYDRWRFSKVYWRSLVPTAILLPFALIFGGIDMGAATLLLGLLSVQIALIFEAYGIVQNMEPDR